MAGLLVVGGPYDGDRVHQPFRGSWVYLLDDGRVTTKAEYGERRGGELYRSARARSLDPDRTPRGVVLFYAGNLFVNCPHCRPEHIVYVKRGETCSICELTPEAVRG